MMEAHLTSLELDELVAHLAPRPAHLERCAMCRTRLEARTHAAAAVLQQPEATRRVAALVARLPPPVPATPLHRRWRRVALLAAPLAAAIALVIAGPRDAGTGGTRLKGGPALMLLDASQHRVTRAMPGDRVTLAVGAGGYSHGAVFAIDASGNALTLWPRDGATFARLPDGPEVPLAVLEVTPGDVTVRAVFANQPRPLSEAGLETREVRLHVP